MGGSSLSVGGLHQRRVLSKSLRGLPTMYTGRMQCLLEDKKIRQQDTLGSSFPGGLKVKSVSLLGDQVFLAGLPKRRGSILYPSSLATPAYPGHRIFKSGSSHIPEHDSQPLPS